VVENCVQQDEEVGWPDVEIRPIFDILDPAFFMQGASFITLPWVEAFISRLAM
jgi:hypothetical protein